MATDPCTDINIRVMLTTMLQCSWQIGLRVAASSILLHGQQHKNEPYNNVLALVLWVLILGTPSEQGARRWCILGKWNAHIVVPKWFRHKLNYFFVLLKFWIFILFFCAEILIKSKFQLWGLHCRCSSTEP